MLLSSELIVKPSLSKTYRCFLPIVYLLTVLFVINTSLYLVIKLVLIFSLIFQFKAYFRLGKPHPELDEIKYVRTQWIIINQKGHESLYNNAEILIHNILFQLLRLSTPNKNKILILFNDQLSNHQLRLLHLKTAKY